MSQQTVTHLPAPSQPVSALLPWEEALQVYVDTLNAPSTRRAYGLFVREAFTFLGVADTSDIVLADLARYRAQLVARARQRPGIDSPAGHSPTLSPSSVAQRLTALRGFLRFCIVAGASTISHEALQFVLPGYSSVVLSPYRTLNKEEQEQLVRHLRAASYETAERDLALITILLCTGLRAAEITRLQVGNIVVDDDGDWSLHVRRGKGRKDRRVPLGHGAKLQLRLWLSQSGRRCNDADCATTYVFYGQNGPAVPLTTRRLEQIVVRCVREAGITDKPISPHSFRHTFAMNVLEAGASLVDIQHLLGHANLQATQRYLDHLDYRDLKKWAPEV